MAGLHAAASDALTYVPAVFMSSAAKSMWVKIRY